MKLPYWIRKIVWFFQRGKRGWADCDWWSLDDYISQVMIDAGHALLYNGCHLGCGSDIVEILNDPEARAIHNLYRRMIRFFELHKLLMNDPRLWSNEQLRRDYKASGLLFIRNFGRLWD